MVFLKSSFTAAASGDTGFNIYWLLVFAVAIIDDSERREEQRSKKRTTNGPPPL